MSASLESCGPECRHARRLPLALGDWVWCALRGEPRAIGAAARLCPGYAAEGDVRGTAAARASIPAEAALDARPRE